MLFSDLIKKVKNEKLPVYTHSAKVEAGSVFVALPALANLAQSGEGYIAEVLKLKPFAVVCRPELVKEFISLAETNKVTLIEVFDPRFALGELAKAYYGTDSLHLDIIGITGTNGKTTTAHLLDYLFSHHGKKVGIIGTISCRWGSHYHDSNLTTPGCLENHELFSQMEKDKVDLAFVEVSSHALDQQRLAGLKFKVGVFTNLTQDHLDYHQNMEAYFQAKARLFAPDTKGEFLVINADDSYGLRLLQQDKSAIAYGLNDFSLDNPYLHAELLENSTKGLHLKMSYLGESWELKSHLLGRHNALNLLATQATALALGLKPNDFKVLEDYLGVNGRFERIINNKGLDIFVDYAHTPDALENVLHTLKDVGFKKIITLFGCGGNRDKTKRPLMGEVVSKYSDIAILTSDNPRKEEPLEIMRDVAKGLEHCKKVYTEVDRAKALALAVKIMQPGDALMVAGKGHESYQIIGETKYPFSDQQTLKELLI
ncbi:UDP-N-acetylmuramoyl-L-alanyl-D-glutamate--2,6-diaminopimelate ligase [Desulfovibrio litoralis]|uniref:UDP-N-acetylmuramoyl-L-alanyl-D-glutamate--2,6-diaminopimelate ligase n=1 Tax=Desulfovibrio litoralis DSM 11393 TaxID=1121455 RepID=A0A1M7SLI0_9BACT|nr:UDP-N-acetylmuramoyl-L-alanyl-D-glutamate--2,6-diaminopimelate ligase [Desulfovibrio litoralis]SHN59329.1 UDP-N-acetylmuramoylalanyl-D-glutamate--2,6-diaminopimelate ligase [Desulfovibrio litoralis DSM 11393]